MISAETISRRDLFFSAKKHKTGSKSHGKMPHPPAAPPHQNGTGLTRRQAIPVIAAGTAIAGGIALGLLKPWESLTAPETLESLVSQAKKMEDEYSGADLSNKQVRDKYTGLLAGIYIRYYFLDIPKNQLHSSVVFVDSKKVFEETYVKTNQYTNFPTEYLKQSTSGIPAITTNDHAVYINTSHVIFQKQLTSNDPKFPSNWNPLRSLRLTLLHEFGHAIVQPAADQAIFSEVDPNNTVNGKNIEGFFIRGSSTTNGGAVGLYNPIDEACVELLSGYANNDLFHSFVSKYDHYLGDDVTAIMVNLGSVINSAGIDKIELARLHKASDLKGFLLLLAERYGINPQKINEKDRIIFGFSIFEALIHNNQAILQDYITSAKRHNH